MNEQDKIATEATVVSLGRIYLLVCLLGGGLMILSASMRMGDYQVNPLLIGMMIGAGVGTIFTGAMVGFLMRLLAGISSTLREIANRPR